MSETAPRFLPTPKPFSAMPRPEDGVEAQIGAGQIGGCARIEFVGQREERQSGLVQDPVADDGGRDF
jgi:hypothetical protein